MIPIGNIRQIIHIHFYSGFAQEMPEFLENVLDVTGLFIATFILILFFFLASQVADVHVVVLV